MTNKELKRKTFLETTRNYNKKKEELYKRESERKLYDEGKIGWNEYMKMYKERKEKERHFYKDNENYKLYDEGLITYDEFLELSK